MLPESGSKTRRQVMAEYVVNHDNFAKSYVNRLWGYLLGVGLIEPLDDIRAGVEVRAPHLGQQLRAADDPVAVPEGRRTWVKIRSMVQGVEGFVPLAFLDVLELRGLAAPVEPEPVIEDGCDFLAGDLFATTLRLNLRNAPGRQSGILRNLDPNMLGTAHSGPVSADGIDWIEASIGDETGWLASMVMSSCVGPTPPLVNTGRAAAALRSLAP